MNGLDVTEANASVLGAMSRASPHLVDVCTAGEVIDAFDDGPTVMLHAGPPIDVDEIISSVAPLRGGLIAALLHEGHATDPDAARTMLRDGGVAVDSAHHHGAVGPMAGVISASLPVMVVEDEHSGSRAFVPLNEGLGKVMRFGSYGEDVLDRLGWMQDVLAPTLREAVRRHGPLPLRPILRDALNRGDECHNRNKAATAMLLQVLGPSIVLAAADQASAAECLRFIGANEHFFLNLSMAHSKCTTLAVAPTPGSSIVTAISCNGLRVGIRVAGTGDRWYTTESPHLTHGRWLGGHGPEDGARIIGDSFVSEVNGLGAFAGACAPAITSYVGGTVEELVATTMAMYAITASEHPDFRIPYLDFRGTPFGIDVHAVVRSGIRPAVNAGIAGHEEGIGQVGAGLIELPLEPFTAASDALSTAVGDGRGIPTQGSARGPRP